MPDTQLIEILIAAMVAGVVLFRLYTILGRRTGHEPQPQDRIAPPPAQFGAALRRRTGRPSRQARSLFDIQLADPSFETGHFLSGARTAYEIILKAFAVGDRASLKPLLSDEVYKAFDAEIAAREAGARGRDSGGPHRCPHRGSHAGGPDRRDHGVVPRPVRRSEFATVQRDVTDVWTFARQIGASSPTWTWSRPAAPCPEPPRFSLLLVCWRSLAALCLVVARSRPCRAADAR